MEKQYSISKDIFSKFPGFLRGVVLAYGVTNGESPDELVTDLRRAENALCGQLNPDNLLSEARLSSWREAYRAAGIKPSEFRPSVEALARRVLRRDALPTINTIVDIGNVVSIKNLVPIGAHAIDVLTQDIEVRYASGEEVFAPFGSDTIEHPLPGEIIFVEGNIVLTRRWTWRQSKHTLVVPETHAVEINVDGLPPVSLDDIEQICLEVATLVQKYCTGTIRYEVLSIENPTLSF
jgi:DNA/RNA-binding domain of Phe-tRNA-synthetase-like protein